MKILGIIPARGGSKRIPNKNIIDLCGKPLIAYTIEAALKSKYIDRLIVSTDSARIGEVAKKYGAEAPFLRPAKFARDGSPDAEVLRHALKWLRANDCYRPDIAVYLRPTTPLKKSRTIDSAIKKLIDSNAQIVRTITTVEGVYHPYWMYRMRPGGFLASFIKGVKIDKYYQRQLLPKAYRINGVVDAMRASVIDGGKFFDSKKMVGLLIGEEESIDIDTEFDLRLCKFIMRKK